MELVKVDTTYHPVVILSLNRPEKRNALNRALITSVCEAVEKSSSDPRTRALIFKGEGPLFCAGLDLRELQEGDHQLTPELVQRLFQTVLFCPIPTLAMVHGAAIAGGLGIAAACDFVIAERQAAFSLPEIRRGIVPALIMPLLARRLDASDLAELLFFEQQIDAEKARSIGLVNRVVEQEALLAEALYCAEKILEGSPDATRKTKQLLSECYMPKFAELMEQALRIHKEARASKEVQEGISAFFDKETP